MPNIRMTFSVVSSLGLSSEHEVREKQKAVQANTMNSVERPAVADKRLLRRVRILLIIEYMFKVYV